MDAVEAAQSGHPGTPMALAPAAYVLWSRFLRHHPAHPGWADRDRFVLSCGHASMLLYSLLHLSGYDLPIEEIKAFRQWGSRTPGHPERGHTPGVETTTGPLGQGVANAVGMAIAERVLAEHFNRPDHRVVDHRVWVFASDGDLMEGVASEAASLAGHLRLGKLTVIYDDNHITIDGDTALTFSEDVQRRFEALRLARRPGGRRQRSRRHHRRARGRSGRARSADAGHPSHVHRRSGPDQAQLRRRPRSPARRGRGAPHQGDHGLAGRAAVLRAGRCAGPLAYRARSGRGARVGVARALGALRGGASRPGGGVRALDVGRAAGGMGQRAARAHRRRRRARHSPGVGAGAPGHRGRGAESGRRIRRSRRQHRHDAQAGRDVRPHVLGPPVPLGRAGARDGARS